MKRVRGCCPFSAAGFVRRRRRVHGRRVITPAYLR